MKRKYTTPNMRIVPLIGPVVMQLKGSNTVSNYSRATITIDDDTYSPSNGGSSRENIFIGEDEDE